MALWHFSEDAAIEVFEPHVPKTSDRQEALVWAIDDWHAPMYFTPRDCPRVCFYVGQGTSDADRERWLAGLSPRFVMVIESRWLERLRAVRLFRYSMPSSTFELSDASAGHHISRVGVRPLSVEPVGDLLEAIASATVELRITSQLGPLWQRLKSSTLEYSGTRLPNAQDYPEAFR